MARLKFTEIEAWEAACGLTRAETARRLGVTSQRLNGWRTRGQVSADETDRVREIISTIHMARKIVTSVTNEDLSNADLAGSPATVQYAPVVGNVRGGMDGYFEEIPLTVGDSDRWVPYRGKDKNAFGLRVMGDSMAPRYNHGEYIVACPSIPFSRGKYVYVALKNGQKLVKRMGDISEDAFELISVNNHYPPKTVLKSDVERICVVQGPFDPDDVRVKP